MKDHFKIKSKKERLSRKEKEANKFQWYKDQANRIINYGIVYGTDSLGVPEERRIQTNYDLFNNKLNMEDLAYVCNPLGSRVGELPARMSNRDISSPKINSLLGMEMKRPFSYKCLAVNSEATTRKEQEYFNRIRDYVTSYIMLPIRQQNEAKFQEQLQNRELTKEEQDQIYQQIEEETRAQTPDSVKKYMSREHQDPAEILYQQLLTYLSKRLNLDLKFNKLFKYGLLTAYELAYVGIMNGEPVVWPLNPKRFRSDQSSDLEFIEDGEWATYDYLMSSSQIIRFFGEDLKKNDVDRILENDAKYYGDDLLIDDVDLFSFNQYYNDYNEQRYTKVTHCQWKALREIKFLTYIDEEGNTQETIVDETYELNTDFGDISITSEWFPETYETWVIHVGEKIYVRMQPLENQFKDIENLDSAKLSYYGARHSDTGSHPVSIMDRLKHFQYYYNILWYKFELLAASDKGKKVLMNINAVPDSVDFDLEKWQYYMEATPYMWYDPNEEGTGYQDANTVAKVIDLSYAGQMNQYIEMMEYVRQQAGRSIGVTDMVEGKFDSNDPVRNAQQSLIQSSNLLEPYFNLHDHVKRNILQALVTAAKIAYKDNPKEYLSFVLDDMSMEILKIEEDLLDSSIIGIFIANSAKAEEAMNTIKQLSHAAMQNQKAELSDIAAIMRQEGLAEAEEVLLVAEQNRREQDQQAEAQKQEQMKEFEKMKNAEAERNHEREKEIIILKEEERRKTEAIKGAFMGASYNPDKDADNNGINDYLQIAEKLAEENFKLENLDLEKMKFRHQQNIDNKKLSQEDRKLSIEREKIRNSNNKTK